MSSIILHAETRADVGKGASRRLRRLENKVPGIIYGGEKQPETILLAHNQLIKSLENESIYSSVIDVKIKDKVEHVVLKDLQRHPYKPVIMHIDLQRVAPTDVLVKHVPIHFINENLAPGLKAGGILNHSMTQVEVKCQVKDLPAFIEVDVASLELNGVIHLSQLKLPTNVHLAHEVADSEHDAPVISIHLPRAAAMETETETEETEATDNTAENAVVPTTAESSNTEPTAE